MFRPTNDIHMEDGDPATNGQYFPEFDGLHAVTAFDGHLMTELRTNSSEQLSARHHGMFHPSSANLLLPLDQPSAPAPYTLESDVLFTSDMSLNNYSTWTHCDTGTEFQKPSSGDMTTDSSFYSQFTTFPDFPKPRDCLYENINPNISHESTLVDMPGCDGFPLGTTCSTPKSNFYPAFSNYQPNDQIFMRQETCNSDFNLRMELAGSADHKWPRLQDDTTGSWRQSINCNMLLDTGTRSFPQPSSQLPEQFTDSTPSSPTWLSGWQIAKSAHVQQPLHQGSNPSFERKRQISDDAHPDPVLRDREQRVSKRARIPQSSVHIVSFGKKEKFRVTREPRTGSQKGNMQDLALLGGSCSRCEHTKKRCEKQTPCARCVKFWTRDWNKSLSKTKGVGSASVSKLSVAAKQTKHVLAYIYNKMNAFCRTTPNLPKLLSVLNILTPNERRLLLSVFGDLQPKAIKDLGCYSYIIRIILATATFPDGLSNRISLNVPLEQEDILNTLDCCQAVRQPYFAKHTTHVSSIVGHAFGRTPDMDLIESGPRDLAMNNTASSFKNIQQSFELSLLERVRQGAAQNHLNLHPLCPHLFELVELIRHAVKDIYSYDTCVGSYEVSVICRPVIPDAAIGVAVPFIVSRLESASGRAKTLQAVGWLMGSPVGNTDSVTSLIEAGGSALAARSTNDHWPTPLNLGTMVKLELERLETQLDLEMGKLEREHGTCRCESCMPL